VRSMGHGEGFQLNLYIEKLLKDCQKGYIPNPDEATRLLQVDLDSWAFYALCATANYLTRKHFDNQAEVCAQIGLDYAPCSKSCGFCAFSKSSGVVKEAIYWDEKTLIQTAKSFAEAGANAIYLMSTANYPFSGFVSMAEAVRISIPRDIPMVANTGDLTLSQAHELKDAGFTAVYHALRLREGTDTRIPASKREETISNAKEVGLVVQVCVEPVGPEHTIEELVDLMFWGREHSVSFSGAMKRTAVPGTALAKHGEITFRELARIVAVTRLVMGDTVQAHCTHEPNLPALMAGANLIWAEAGPNPRDTEADTQYGRGQNVKHCRRILEEAGFKVRKGASIAALPSVLV